MDLEKIDKTNTSIIKYSKTDNVLTDICSIIESARDYAFQSVNLALVERNWLIGYRIAEEELKGEDRADYGTEVIKKLSKEGRLTRDVAMSILSEGKEKLDENTGSRKISISIPKEYGEFFPPACSTKEKREKVMIWLLKNYQNEIYKRFGEDYE